MCACVRVCERARVWCGVCVRARVCVLAHVRERVCVRATFAEVPTSGHTAASCVSSVSVCVFTQKLVHFTEYLLCAL